MAGHLTTLSATEVISECERGVYLSCEGTEPLDLLARGIVEMHTGKLETAKDLLSEAYWKLDGEWKDKAGVQLSYAYWMGGEKEEAIALLDALPASFDALLMLAITQCDTDPQLALETLGRAEVYDVSRYKIGRLHNLRGICFRRLGHVERADEEYQAALYFLEDCPLRDQVEANWSYAVKDPRSAHQKLDRAIESLEGPCLGQAYDAKAQRFFAEPDLEKAERYATWAVDLLESGERRSWLVEALLTRSEILVKRERHDRAFGDLFRARDLASYLGDNDLRLKVSKRLDTTARQTSKFYHVRSVQLALATTDSLNSAARKLEISRQALQDFIRSNHLSHDYRPRKSIITKY